MRIIALCLVVSLVGCGATTHTSTRASGTVTVSLVGTNDTHGRVGNLPYLASYLSNLRSLRARDQGGVVLIDGGDMFQGTLESNLNEGASVVQAYALLGYDAAAVGNHEFDFGPVGPRETVGDAGDDPRGALLARALEAPFPILSANLVRDGSNEVFALGPRGGPSVVIERAGLRIGIIGGSTESTPHTTIAANLHGLHMLPLGETLAREAERLRASGVDLVFVAMHAGGKCRSFDDPDDTSSCEQHEEIQDVTSALRPGLVDAIVAGHTHAGIAHRFNGTPVIESLSNAQAFGRIDFTIDVSTKRVQDVHIFAPTHLCGQQERSCEGVVYEGAPVHADEAMLARLQWAFDAARAKKEERLGASTTEVFHRHYGAESALGNLLADLMLESTPGADVALMNGGGIRADLPAGAVTYGALFEVFPFDNMFARVEVTGAQLASILAHNLGRDAGILSVAGVRAAATCEGGHPVVRVTRADGRPIADDERIVIITSDFIATGGDGVFQTLNRHGGVHIEDARPVIRDALAERLRLPHGPYAPSQFFSPDARRLRYPGERPMRCAD